MSRYSTSIMLGKLAAGQGKTQTTTADLDQEAQDVTEVFAVPQLKPSPEPKPEMKEVLANILGPSASKKHSPMDKC